jgi:hypothetical protein
VTAFFTLLDETPDAAPAVFSPMDSLLLISSLSFFDCCLFAFSDFIESIRINSSPASKPLFKD